MNNEIPDHTNHSNSKRNLAVIKLGSDNSFFEVIPNEGGRIGRLVVDNCDVIKDPEGVDYADSYAASVLFPFPNRVEDGVYNFNNVDYQLTCNQIKEHNALHGLIYNQTFEVVKQSIDNKNTQVKLLYESDGSFDGFPFKFKVELTYQLNNNKFYCSIKVTNTDACAFPFAMGWHPYFFTSEKETSTLELTAKNQLINNHRNIPVEAKSLNKKVTLKLNESYDDCFELAVNEALFKTPHYNLTLKLDKTSKYLQIYTPADANVVAIEPMTAPANSFNNALGLKILDAGATHSETYTLSINKTNP
jgi:aldose 1-epimerase